MGKAVVGVTHAPHCKLAALTFMQACCSAIEITPSPSVSGANRLWMAVPAFWPEPLQLLALGAQKRVLPATASLTQPCVNKGEALLATPMGAMVGVYRLYCTCTAA